MSFALQIKSEILSQNLKKQEALAFLEGVLTTYEKHNKYWHIKFKNKNLMTKFQTILQRSQTSYFFEKDDKETIYFQHENKLIDIESPGYFIAGVFLGGGSISDPSSNYYHLELQFFSHFQAERIKHFLNKYDFNFSLIQRRKLWVLYIKKAEQLSDFLKAIQAFNSLLYFEDFRIQRDFKNQLNRYSNLDSYNQKKLAKSSSSFKENYAFIKKHKLLTSFSNKELAFFEIKNNNPYSSLNELVKLFNKKTNNKTTKSGLNHYLIKLRKVIFEVKNKI